MVWLKKSAQDDYGFSATLREVLYGMHSLTLPKYPALT